MWYSQAVTQLRTTISEKIKILYKLFFCNFKRPILDWSFGHWDPNKTIFDPKNCKLKNLEQKYKMGDSMAT